MHYHYYKKSRDAAWQILIDSDIETMPVSVLKICRSLGIKVIYYDFLDENELGRVTFLNNIACIMIRRNLDNKMKRYVCAHELGHLILNHFSEGTSYSCSINDIKHGLESGAEQFAIRLLCPICILWKCNITTAEEASEVFGIEKFLAEKRVARLKLLKKRDKFLTSPLEIEVYNKFLPFIEKYLLDKKQ